jgi:hypothetical protein
MDSASLRSLAESIPWTLILKRLQIRALYSISIFLQVNPTC